mmetsp:Transcript_35287/g.76197  ORF Transcript_35287/g.76197 Transcript_35287/m.76197 type:complete len:299 (+) Transcript_35287:393-1289(+)
MHLQHHRYHPTRLPLVHRRFLPPLCRLSRLFHANRLRHDLRRLRPRQQYPEHAFEEPARCVWSIARILYGGIRLCIWRVVGGLWEDYIYWEGQFLFDGSGEQFVLVVSVCILCNVGDHCMSIISCVFVSYRINFSPVTYAFVDLSSCFPYTAYLPLSHRMLIMCMKDRRYPRRTLPNDSLPCLLHHARSIRISRCSTLHMVAPGLPFCAQPQSPLGVRHGRLRGRQRGTLDGGDDRLDCNHDSGTESGTILRFEGGGPGGAQGIYGSFVGVAMFRDIHTLVRLVWLQRWIHHFPDARR